MESEDDLIYLALSGRADKHYSTCEQRLLSKYGTKNNLSLAFVGDRVLELVMLNIINTYEHKRDDRRPLFPSPNHEEQGQTAFKKTKRSLNGTYKPPHLRVSTLSHYNNKVMLLSRNETLNYFMIRKGINCLIRRPLHNEKYYARRL